MANTKERIDALEAQIHDMIKSDQDAPGILKQFSLRLDALEVNLEATDNTRYAESMEWEGKFQELQDRVEHHARHSGGIDWESKFQELQDRVELLSRAVVNTPVGGAEHSSRPRVPEPKSYGGARDAKELENFLFDIEQYFRAIRVDSEATKVSMAAMYLVGDAKLWWRKKYAEIEDGSCVINTWEILKRELKSQFFPENTAFNARKALLECKHTGSVREYCQAFSALMLDISDMSAVDRLFFFMEGLKPWARTELNRRRVNNLNEAIIAAESLSDYNSEPQRPPQRGNPSRGIGGKKPGGPMPNQSWGSKSSWASNSSTQQKSGVGFKAKPDASTSGEVKKPPFRGCFLCQGPHVIANCPQRQMMNAFFDNIGQVQRGEQSGSRPRHPPTDEQTDTQDYEEEDAVGAFPQWCNAVTTQVGNPKKSSTGEEPKDMPPKKKGDVPGKGLMYVDIKVNGKAIRAMVDTGATHNYISSTEVERLGLTLEKGCGRVKAINSAAQPVAGIARSVLIKIGPYEGRTNFSVVIMDDFKLILGLEFLRDTKTTARWQELLAEFNFMLEYRTGSTNSVADALSRRAELDQVALMAMNAIVRADSRVAINIGKKIKKALTRDPVAQQLLKLIESGKTRQFWQEDGLLMTKGRRLCFNSRKSSSTGKSAFEIVNGQQPLLPHTVNVPNAGKSPRAISFSEEWRQNIDLAHSYLEKAARRMKKHADKNRRSQEFNVGDKVMVKLLQQDRKFLRGRDSRLLQKYEGPLTIVKKIGKMAYKVDPPHWWSRQLHPVFHVSMLKPFYEDTADPSRGQIKRQGLKPKAAGKRVAEAILNDRVIIASRKRHQEYLVKWQGQMDEENTWERAADLSAYADKIEAYHMQKLTRASTALVGENVTGCPLHPPSTAPPRPSSSAPPRPSNRRPCALTSSSSLAPMRPSSTAPARPIAVPAHPPSIDNVMLLTKKGRQDILHLHIVYLGALPNGKYSPLSHHSSLLQEIVDPRPWSEATPRASMHSQPISLTRNAKAWLIKHMYSNHNHAGRDGVVSVFPSRILQPQTTRSWDFTGLSVNAGGTPTIESDVIVGILDTGIWPESKSFSDEGFGPAPKKWKGACKGGTNFTCNNKLIGARYYTKNEDDCARDTDGHGTHTASTVAGNVVKNASFYGLARGTARGGVPSARIATFKVCGQYGCFDADILAGFDDAIADGADIITISLGAESTTGNSGFTPGTISSVAPWMLTVAASIIDRRIVDKVVLGNGKTLGGNVVNSFELNGKEFPLGYDHAFQRCLDKDLVKGNFLLCRNAKGCLGAKAVGALGTIVPSGKANDTSFVVPLPTAVLNESNIELVHTYINSTKFIPSFHRNPKASISKSKAIRDYDAPVVASFSSKGPIVIIPDILKVPK
ncbi:hypothetical protein RJ639_026381 [Escallonia herrerae]|uniref:Chromo domain-containing protein n=1 Tax=Escallonia herrerae TaxID=1293975 RepID=A0AA88USK7_9ASTE|nr:hypothetical protein RJ639_026381 [Escallonia herrerae]